MAETRLEKYRRYRESLNEVKENTKDDAIINARRDRLVTDLTNSTTTLPIDQVLGEIDKDNDEATLKVVTIRKFKIALFTIIGILVVIALGVFAIIAFGGKN